LPDVSTGVAYAGHFLLYAALGFSALTASYRRNAVVVAAVILAAAAFGGLLELYQSTLSGRESSFFDGLANLAGAACGAGTAAALLPHWSRWFSLEHRS
jgi:VanZ family protein